jgi:FSR family fosmidomycin resistance protein-like MFS transporter
MGFIAPFSHFFSDFFVSFFKPMAPYFMSVFGIDSSTFGSMLGIIVSSASLLQILFGFLFDRTRRDGLAIFLLLFSQLFILCFLVFANNFVLLMVLIFISILLNSAYHPVGAGIAGLSGKARTVAVFSIFGTFGSALGPVFITSYSSWFGFRNVIWFVLPMFLCLLLSSPKMIHFTKEVNEKQRTPTIEIFKLLLPCFTAVLLRSIVMDQFHTYVPIYFRELGAPLFLGGLVMTIGILTGIGTNYFGSRLIQKIGIFRINCIGFFGMGISGLLFTFCPGELTKVLLFALFDSFGFLTMSANIVHAQQLVPNNRAFASSVTMGFAWSVGGYIGAALAAFFGNTVALFLYLLSGFSLIVALFYLLVVLRNNKKARLI